MGSVGFVGSPIRDRGCARKLRNQLVNCVLNDLEKWRDMRVHCDESSQRLWFWIMYGHVSHYAPFQPKVEKLMIGGVITAKLLQSSISQVWLRTNLEINRKSLALIPNDGKAKTD